MSTALALAGVTKRFGAVTAVDNVSLEIPGGLTVALLGPNGAGKTTTVSLLMGLADADSGTVTVAGGSPRAAVLSGRIAAMLQDSGLMPGVRVCELVDLAARMYPAPMAGREALELAGLTEVASTRVERLSVGQAQRLRFALVAVADPAIMLLDEPTRALDVQGRREFWASMRRSASRGVTIVFATHYLDEVEQNADRVVVMAGGRIVADGSPTEVRTASGTAEVRFRLPAGAALPVLPGAVTLEHGWATLRTADPDGAVRLLAGSAANWSDLRVSPPTLDDSFLALTTEGSTKGSI